MSVPQPDPFMPIRNMKTALLLVLLLLLASSATAAVAPGRITVYSTPTGALACVDAKTCDITGATFTVEGNAWHAVTITQKGYKPWTDRVFVTSDQISMVEAYLDLDANATAIQVIVRPGGGTICLDNGDCRSNVGSVAGNADALFTGVSPGFHTISVESPAGYLDTTKLVKVELGKTTDVTLQLDPFVAPTSPVSRATGTVRVYVDRTGSTVCMDNADCYLRVGGVPGPGTGTSVFNDVTADELHIVTVAADGYRPVSTQVRVGQDQIATVDVKLQPLTAATTVSTPVQTPAVTQPTTLLTPLPTRSAGPGVIPVLGVLALCGVVFLCRSGRK